MLLSLALVFALGVPAQSQPTAVQEGGKTNQGCCSYRRSDSDKWTCVDTTKHRCDSTIKKLAIPKDQHHFTLGKKCAENPDCGAGEAAPK